MGGVGPPGGRRSAAGNRWPTVATDVEAVQTKMTQIASRKPASVVFRVKRGIRTFFVELQGAGRTDGDGIGDQESEDSSSGDRLKRIIAAAAVAGVSAAAGAASAQDARAAAREVVKKWQEAVVNVRVVLKTRMSMGGREMQSADDSVDAVGTVIDPSGLTVMSLGSLNPGAMMNKIVGASVGGGGSENRVEISSEPTDLKIRLARRPRDAREDRAARRGPRSRVHPSDHEASGAARRDQPGGVGEARAAGSEWWSCPGSGESAAGRRRRRWSTSAP